MEYYCDPANTLDGARIHEVNEHLSVWLLTYQQDGNTIEAKNKQGNLYITFAIGFLGKDLSSALYDFKIAITDEAEKTGFISIRQYPELVPHKLLPYGQTYILRARIVSYNPEQENIT